MHKHSLHEEPVWHPYDGNGGQTGPGMPNTDIVGNPMGIPPGDINGPTHY